MTDHTSGLLCPRAMVMTMSMKFGLALRHAMLDAGMTQEQLAEGVGLSTATVNRHVRGVGQPTLPQMEAYSRVLGVAFHVAPATGLEPVTYRFQAEGSAA